jgi:DNA-binding NarL/FixJ family response regulator
MMTPHLSAVIADDHHIVRSGLKMALEMPGLITPEGIAVVGEAEDGMAAIVSVKQHKPDLVLLDVSMPRASGVEVVSEIKRWCPKCKIVIFTGISSPGIVRNLVELKVDGLFTKSASNDLLYEKLPLILKGGRHIAESFLSILEKEPEEITLTKRERQTLNMIIRGKANKEISADLGISVKTVESHRTSLMQKLGVNSVTQLMAKAVKDGMIDPANEL